MKKVQGMRQLLGGVSIDLGTQATSVAWVSLQGKLVATGTVKNRMVEGLIKGHKEQRPNDWVNAAAKGMKKLRAKLAVQGQAIGYCAFVIVNGQMHGEVIMTKDGCMPTARLWCDSRNEDQGKKLTDLFGVKVPTRMTVARWLWTVTCRPEVARACTGLTTPAGWLTYKLCGVRDLGIGEASGMFPMDISTGDYRRDLVQKFDPVAQNYIGGLKSIYALLPRPRKAGSFIGGLNAEGAKILGLPVGTPVPPPEGDQPAILAGTCISTPGQIGGSVGTSICANLLSGSKPFEGVHPAIDHFCDPMGRPIHMAWIKNGTTFANTVIELLRRARGDKKDDATYAYVIPQAIRAPADCGGLRALPLMETEPATRFVDEAYSMFAGVSPANFTPGNMYKAAFLASCFSVRLGLEELRRQGCPAKELTLTGGVLKTKTSTRFAANLIASALDIPVRVLPGAVEGTAFGGGLLGLFAHRRLTEPELTYEEFLKRMLGTKIGQVFMPDKDDVKVYGVGYRKYIDMLAIVEPALIATFTTSIPD